MNYFPQILSLIFTGSISFLLSLFIAREVGPTNFGEYSIAISLGAVFLILFDGGFRTLILRERTKDRALQSCIHNELPNIASAHSIVVLILISVLFVFFFPKKIHFYLGIILCFWSIAINQYASSILRGDGLLKVDAIFLFKQRIFTAFFISSAILLGFIQTYQILLAWALGSILSNLLLKEGFRSPPSFNHLLSHAPGLYRPLFALMCIDLATVIYFRSDIVMLQAFNIVDNEIGQYAAAYRLIEAPILLFSPISIIFFRKILFLQSTIGLQRKFIYKSILLSGIFSLIGVILFGLFAEQLVFYAYGSEYSYASSLLPLLGWMIVLCIPNSLLTQAALALSLERDYAKTALVAAIANISLNFIFIPDHGILACAYNSIATEIILLIGLIFIINRKLNRE